jgi:hypothetical protein
MTTVNDLLGIGIAKGGQRGVIDIALSRLPHLDVGLEL